MRELVPLVLAALACDVRPEIAASIVAEQAAAEILHRIESCASSSPAAAGDVSDAAREARALCVGLPKDPSGYVGPAGRLAKATGCAASYIASGVRCGD